jgi:hypothetical protein
MNENPNPLPFTALRNPVYRRLWLTGPATISKAIWRQLTHGCALTAIGFSFDCALSYGLVEYLRTLETECLCSPHP